MASLKTGLITVAALALATPLYAAPAGRSVSRVDDLRAAQERVARAASSTKGGPQQRLLLEQQKLSGMIDDLEQGRSVDPQEIDRALQRAEQGTP
jgi:hypothetical protein